MAKRNNLTPQFEWDEASGQYRHVRGGRYVPRLAVRAALDDYLENKSTQVVALAEQLRAREISLPDFQRAMERNVARIHLANAAAAKGGWAQMDQADYGRVGRLVRDEYKYLRRMAIQIENGLPLDGHYIQRVTQYAQAGRHTYHVFETRGMLERGLDEQRFIRHAGDSCSECVALAALGWHPTGSTPEPGERICKRKCKCGKEYRPQPENSERASLASRSPVQRNALGRLPDTIPDIEVGKSVEETSRNVERHLREVWAKPGVYEQSVLVTKTNRVIQSASSENERTTLRAKKSEIAGAALHHSHPIDLPPSARDFHTLTSTRLQKSIVVTPRRTYTLKKPEGWKNPYPNSPFFAAYRGLLERRLVDKGFSETQATRLLDAIASDEVRADLLSDVVKDALQETIKETARFYNLRFSTKKW